MGRLRRKRMHKNIKDIKKKYRTKRRTKDLDQVHVDMKEENAKELLDKRDPDLPGGGAFYCLNCARHFVDDKSLQDHFKTKVHKKRMTALKEKPYTIEESEAAGGQGSYHIIGTKPLLETDQEMKDKEAESSSM